MTTSLVEESPLYVILREHEEYGPFSKETLREAMETGNLVAEDWVRKADRTSCWTSLGKLLYGPPEPEQLTVKVRRILKTGFLPVAKSAKWMQSAGSRVLELSAMRLERAVGVIAFLSIAIASGIAFLPGHPPIAISMPWMLAGVVAGLALILRRKVFRGVVTCLGASILPISAFLISSALEHYLDPNRREDPLPPVGEMYSNMPRKSADMHKDQPRAKSGIPTLGLPQRTEDGR